MRTVISLLLTFMTIATFSQTKFGGGIALTTSKIGFQIKADIPITDAISISPYITYLLPESDSNNKEAYGINVDGHYNFELGDSFKLYPLLGVRYYIHSTYWEHYYDINNGAKVTYKDFQLNAGGGAQYSISERINLYAEGKITGFSAGILFSL